MKNLLYGVMVSLCALTWFGNSYGAETEPEIDFDQLYQAMDDAGLESMHESTQPSAFMVMIRKIFSPMVVYLIQCYDWFSGKLEQQRIALSMMRTKQRASANDSEPYVNG